MAARWFSPAHIICDAVIAAAADAAIAAIARFIGKSLPSPSNQVMRVLPGVEQIHVAKAIALLRLARALNQGRRGAVRGHSSWKRRSAAVTTETGVATCAIASRKLMVPGRQRGDARVRAPFTAGCPRP